MLANNVINFINSKDSLTNKNSLLYRLIYLFMLLICCSIEILFFCFNINFIGKTSKLYDLVVTVLIATLGLSNFIASLFISFERYHHMYYGISSLLFSVFMLYMGIRIALFPLSELYGLLGIGLWFIISALNIVGIIDNIKYDKYNIENPNIYWIGKTNEKCGIVITKFTIINFFIVVGSIIVLALLYFALFPELFTARDATFSRVWQIEVVIGLLLLSYIGNFAWKLVIKQIYLNRARL